MAMFLILLEASDNFRSTNFELILLDSNNFSAIYQRTKFWEFNSLPQALYF